MSTFDPALVQQVAKLSRLAYSDSEATALADQMSSILGYIDKLNALDTHDVEPTSHALEMVNVLRDDVTQPSLSPEDALANAPETEAQCFKVPQIIQEM